MKLCARINWSLFLILLVVLVIILHTTRPDISQTEMVAISIVAAGTITIAVGDVEMFSPQFEQDQRAQVSYMHNVDSRAQIAKQPLATDAASTEIDNINAVEDSILRATSQPRADLIPYNPAALNADELLAQKQKERGNMQKRALDIATNRTRDSFQRFYTDELAEAEEREWYNIDDTDVL